MEEKFDYIKHYKTDACEFDYFEERPAATAHDERRVREYIISKVKKDTEKILDVGAGSAWVAKYFCPKNKTVISLDIAIENLIKAREQLPLKNHKQTVADSFRLPFPDNSFDTVIASEIIEHVTNPELFVKELFRTVKPGGELIITTPYKEKIRYALCIHCNKKTPLNGHLHSFDEKILLDLYNGENVESKEWFTFGNKALIYFMTYVILKYLPFPMWKIIDKTANRIWNKPVHILIKFKKNKTQQPVDK